MTAGLTSEGLIMGILRYANKHIVVQRSISTLIHDYRQNNFCIKSSFCFPSYNPPVGQT